VDAAEDELYGDRRDDSPPELSTSEARKAWLRETMRELADEPATQMDEPAAAEVEPAGDSGFEFETSERLPGATNQCRRGWLREARRQLDQHRAAHPRPIPRSSRGRLLEAMRQLDEELDAERQANPDSRLLKARKGYVQGYNAQVVTNEHQIVIAAEVTTESGDFGHLEPMFAAAERELAARLVSRTSQESRSQTRATGTTSRCRTSSTAAPRCSSRRRQQTQRPQAGVGRRLLRAHGPGADDRARRRPIPDAPTDGRARLREHQAQPRDGPVRRRGRSAARSEWRPIKATHNLLKAHKHQIAHAGA
jgi:hypothetical protein